MRTPDIQQFPLQSTEESNGNGLDIRKQALTLLGSHLPTSLPLYRRLQFGRFFPATTLLTNLSLDSGDPSESPWLIAFIDRSCRPETEIWLFCSWEAQIKEDDETFQDRKAELLRDLLLAIKNLPIPTSIHQDILNAKADKLQYENAPAEDSVGLSRDDYASHMLDPSITLWGAIHERTVPILESLGVCSGERFKAMPMPNLMFIWDVDSLPPQKELPARLSWGDLKSEHFALVRSRTQIPRQDRTLAVLENLAIYAGDATPLAWAFVGLDASLTTLHVEAEWRGRGLAKAITAKLFREKMSLFWRDGEKRLAHGYVIRGNQESEGMCRSIGGKADWDVYWVRVDLTAVV